MREITEALHQDLKKLEFDYKPKGSFGIGMSLKVKRDRPTPIHYYRENRLETEVICGNCTLRYSVYGVFAFCPDCRQHNSLHILDRNLEVIGKMVDLASSADKELGEKLTENSLEDCISSFDGFGRELCRLYAKKAAKPALAEKVRFQNLDGAKQTLIALFSLDLAAGLTAEEWKAAIRGFQKRHLLSHKMGVVDEEYIRKSDDLRAVVGRKVGVSADEVREIVLILGRLAQYMAGEITKLHGSL